MKFLKHGFVFLVGLVSLLYLTNPGAGVIELIPDNFPFLGNIDEAAATTLLIASLAYFGVDVSKWFPRQKQDVPTKTVDVEVEKAPRG